MPHKKGKNMDETRELKLFDIMDKYDTDMDAAELILQDMEEEHDEIC